MKFGAQEAGSPDQTRQHLRMNSLRTHLTVLGSLVVILSIVLVPVASVRYLPGIDLPNHLARHYISAALDNSPPLQGFYTFDWQWIPNLAGDFLASLLGGVLSVLDVGRCILALSLSLWIIAPLVLNRVIWGRFSTWPLFVALVVYNGNVAWGFENYFLSSALALFVLALWIATDKLSHYLRLPLISLCATIVYFGHLIAFGLLGLSIFAYEVGRLLRTGGATKRILASQLALIAIPFSPAAIYFVATALTGSPAHGSGTAYDLPNQFVHAVLSPTATFQFRADAAIFLIVILVLFVGIRVTGWLKVHPAMLPVLWCTSIVAAAIPTTLFGVAFTDIRLPFVVVALTIASCRFEGGKVEQRTLATLLVAVLCFRVVTLLVFWRAHEEEVEELVATFRQLEMAPRILVAAAPKEANQLAHSHSASYAVIERDAFLPNLFTGATLLRTTPQLQRIDHPQAGPVQLRDMAEALKAGDESRPYLFDRPYVFWRTWWRDFTHVLVYTRQDQSNCFPGLLDPVSYGTFFVLYRVNPGQNVVRSAAMSGCNRQLEAEEG